MLSIYKEYNEFLETLKGEIKESQRRAISSVNKELIILYWKIGKAIILNQKNLGWGSKVIPQLSLDLNREFPNMKGFSERNLKYMKKLAEEYPRQAIVQQVVAQLSWSHNLVLMDRVKDVTERLWYISKCVENQWSRNVLIHQIESGLYKRQELAEKTTNFEKVLGAVQLESAIEIIKDPYIFDFIAIEEKMKERDIEKQLVEKITNFLLELGSGFAFVGNQYHLSVGNEDFYIDLLFYHIKLKCYVVIELKTGKFKPEYAGKLNFYLAAVDELLKTEEDKPSIGIILCKEKNKTIVEYALKDMTKPIGVSEYKISEEIPTELQKSLPSIEALEKELDEI